jgi:hypothetical protein
MGLTLEQFSGNFREYPVPAILEDLFLFQEVSNEWYSGGFELNEMPLENIKAHIDESLASQFFGIGHDANYSIYVLWLYKKAPLDEAPIVYLSSEGEGTSVLANTLTEFLTLLAWDEDPILGEYQENEAEIEHTARNQEFRAWIQDKYYLQPTSKPNEVIRNARLSHPKLPIS